ncbi:TPA: hypothetical protein QCX89_005210 [Bacillus cereus]|nr:hypothetical protein [Bacillus thuringiensis]HDR7713111.1 hypothetical protein [Bacillus cereus]
MKGAGQQWKQASFLGLFWDWRTVIISGVLFIRPSVLRELKKFFRLRN